VTLASQLLVVPADLVMSHDMLHNLRSLVAEGHASPPPSNGILES